MITASTQTRDALTTRLMRGALAGLVAGLLFILATMWLASADGKPADMPLRMISTILKGDAAMADGTTSVGLGWATHLVMSAIFGVVFALVTPMLKTNGTAAIIGTVYGLLLYVVNFLVLAPLVFTTFQKANQPFELVVHVVFGTLVGFAFFSSWPRSSEPLLALGKNSRETTGV